MSEEITATVLVVDDVQSNIEFVKDVLEIENLNLVGANNGEEAVKVALEIKPDLILLDISMPVMDGFQACKLIKEDPEIQDIPVIFLTARVQKEDIVKGFNLGAVDYILKPFNIQELVQRVKTHIDLKQKTKRLQNINSELESKVECRTLELKEANDDLQIAMKELAKLDKAKTDFVLHINHELRTPLNGILGYIHILEENIADNQLASHLGSIKTLTDRLIKVAELSLLFTELNTQAHKIDFQKVDLSAAILDTIDIKELESKNLEVEIENPYDSLYVFAEPKLLYTCFSIIFDNAIKYSPEDESIKISAFKDNGFIEYSISDKGPGFSEKALSNVFNFLSADNLDHQSHGFGVGLATANIIIDLLGGKIEVTNNAMTGALVKIILPEFTN